MTTDHTPGDVVVLGALPGSSNTHGPRVAHPDRNSPPAGGAVPLHDTPSKPSPVRMVGELGLHYDPLSRSPQNPWTQNGLARCCPLLRPRLWASSSQSFSPSSACWRSSSPDLPFSSTGTCRLVLDRCGSRLWRCSCRVGSDRKGGALDVKAARS